MIWLPRYYRGNGTAKAEPWGGACLWLQKNPQPPPKKGQLQKNGKTGFPLSEGKAAVLGPSLPGGLFVFSEDARQTQQGDAPGKALVRSRAGRAPPRALGASGNPLWDVYQIKQVGNAVGVLPPMVTSWPCLSFPSLDVMLWMSRSPLLTLE